MAKTKSQAAWNGLSVKQRRTLEEWLFEEGLSYNEALARAKKELGFKGQRSSVRRFYEERNRERTLLGFAAAGKMLTAVEGAPVSEEALRDAGMKVAAQVFFKLVTERPEQAKDWLPLAKLLAQGERSAAWREVKDAENEIRRAALDFARTKHQYDMIGQALKALPELEEMEEAQRDPEVTKYERNRRMNDLRKQMFGESIPELLPETPEEEAHPEIVEGKMREATRRQNEEWARQQVEIQKENAELRRRELEAKRPGAGKGGGPMDADENDDRDEKDERENDDEDDPPSPGGSGATRDGDEQTRPENSGAAGQGEGEGLKTHVFSYGAGEKNEGQSSPGVSGGVGEQEILGQREGEGLKTDVFSYGEVGQGPKGVEKGTEDDPPSLRSSGGSRDENDAKDDPPSPGGCGAASDEAEEGKQTAATEPEAVEPFVDEPRKLTPEERERNYRELMRRARGG